MTQTAKIAPQQDKGNNKGEKAPIIKNKKNNITDHKTF